MLRRSGKEGFDSHKKPGNEDNYVPSVIKTEPIEIVDKEVSFNFNAKFEPIEVGKYDLFAAACKAAEASHFYFVKSNEKYVRVYLHW